MALCLLTGFAMAEELNWSDYEGLIAEYNLEGEFKEISDIGVKMFIPSYFQEVELSDEDQSNGYFCYMTNADQTAVIAMLYADGEGKTLDDFAAMLPDLGAADVEQGTINNIPVVTYEMPENDSVNVAFATDGGYIIEFVFNPASDESVKTVAFIMTASIQPV